MSTATRKRATCRGCGAYLRSDNVGRGTCDPCDARVVADARAARLRDQALRETEKTPLYLIVGTYLPGTVDSIAKQMRETPHRVRRALQTLIFHGLATSTKTDAGVTWYERAEGGG